MKAIAAMSVLAMVFGLVVMMPPAAEADSPNFGCPPGWDFGFATSPDAMARDLNGDGLVCVKFLKNDKGKGNGDYLSPNIVVRDNNVPVK